MGPNLPTKTAGVSGERRAVWHLRDDESAAKTSWGKPQTPRFAVKLGYVFKRDQGALLPVK